MRENERQFTLYLTPQEARILRNILTDVTIREARTSDEVPTLFKDKEVQNVSIKTTQQLNRLLGEF